MDLISKRCLQPVLSLISLTHVLTFRSPRVGCASVRFESAESAGAEPGTGD